MKFTRIMSRCWKMNIYKRKDGSCTCMLIKQGIKDAGECNEGSGKNDGRGQRNIVKFDNMQFL